MITINRSTVKKIIQENEHRPKPRLIISISKSSHRSEIARRILDETPPEVSQQVREYGDRIIKEHREKKGSLSAQCWDEFNQLRIEQGKEANRIHGLIESNADKKAIAELYESVEAFRPDLIRLYDRAKYVDQYGTLPAEEKTNTSVPIDIYSLKDQKRKLVDRRCKLQAKINKGSATNSTHVPEWQMELDQANAEYNLVDEQIKKIEGKL